MPKSSNKVWFNLEIFSATSIVVLNTQIQNSKMRSSNLIIKSDAQNKMAKYSFGHSFMTLNNSKLVFFSYTLNSL